MAKLKDVRRLVAKKGFVSASMISKEFDVPLVRACEILKACWDKGLLLPVDQAWFTLPTAEGGPVEFQGKMGRKRREAWYRPELDLMSKIWEEDESAAMTVMDVAEVTKIEPQRARKVLNILVDKGELIRTVAQHGGAFGRKPYIYSKTVAAVKPRNARLKGEAAGRKTARVAKAKATREGQKTETTPQNPWDIKPTKGKGIQVDIRDEY